ncbi:DUF4232 domain-containing protein [Streptomyces sp. H27-H1]|uniref:DUF4232 domain-containing protein n=1 Tax=Streptomyces sp. H27-H1 TaxID=2996461 RepID=UPI00226E7312|nr:DUF4232 domain-containing protein [Streptomyces sp. H27-H1]MCY0926799.1 DUF4232 domain-containing protein [Streptomyces sp. H27-H1]
MNAAARRSRRSWKAHVLGAATVTALLASTACSPSTGERPDDRKPSGQATTPSTPSTPSIPGSPNASAPGATPSLTPGPGATGTGDNGATSVCADGDLTITATSEDAKGNPPRHILLTATNTGTRACNVYRFPHVQLGGARTLVPELEDSADPAAPAVALAPGKQAYAAMVLTGPMDEAPAKSMYVRLQDRKAGSNAGESIEVALPGVDTLYYNDFARVTHWMTASGPALRFVMSS